LLLLLWCTFPPILTGTMAAFLMCGGLVGSSLSVSDELGQKEELNKGLWLWTWAPGNHRARTEKLWTTSQGISQNWLGFTSIKQLDLIPKFHHSGIIVLISI
jgi:hypothetical protein